jgi:hypothetical protein
MIRRTWKYADDGSDDRAAPPRPRRLCRVTPALAACSKALVETLAKSEPLPAYTVKAPSSFVSTIVDPNSFTVLAHSATPRNCSPRPRARPRPTARSFPSRRFR